MLSYFDNYFNVFLLCQFVIFYRLNAGVSQTTVTAWETGKAEPSSSAVSKLADIFNVTNDYLLGRPNKQETKKDDVELSDDDVIMTWRGKPLSDEDRELIRRIMNGK